MNIIYKTTDTLNDLSYIGSKMNYVEKSDYLGSPSCKVGHPKYKVQQLKRRKRADDLSSFSYRLSNGSSDFYCPFRAIKISTAASFFKKSVGSYFSKSAV